MTALPSSSNGTASAATIDPEVDNAASGSGRSAHETLTAERRWVVWRLEQRGDKATKVPYIADARNVKASSTDPATWSTYEVANATAQNGSGYDGVGVMLGDGLAGIDLDHCVTDGIIEPWAREIIGDVDSYAEESPSGTGVHIIMRGDTSLDLGRSRRGPREFYLRDRYFTYTGRVIHDAPVRAVDLAAVHARLFGPKGDPRPAPDDPRHAASVHADDEVIAAVKRAKNSEKVRALLAGDWTGYPSASDGLFALLGCLIFYTDDAEQLERIVVESDGWADYEPRKVQISVTNIIRDDRGERYSWPVPVTHGERHAADDAEPVTDPAALLDDVARFIGKYVAATPEQLDAIALWAMHTHVFDSFDTSPRLALLSAEKQSGKSRTLEVLDLVTASALFVSNISSAAMFRVIELRKPTILFDEVDAIFGNKTEDDHEDLRSLLNTGHRRGATVPRCVGQGSKMTVHEFPTYAPVAMAAIGKLPDTVMDRSVVVRMKRRAPDEHVAAYRQRRVEPTGHALRVQMAAWADQIREGLREADPPMPDGVADRPADTWEPLLAIADAAGGDWPARARRSCLALIGGEKDDQGSEGVRLLSDIRDVFDAQDEDTIASNDLAKTLTTSEESEWGEPKYGRILDARGIARRLRKYGIRPHQMRDPGNWSRHVQGYARSDFLEAWSRYLPPVTEHAAPPRPYVLADLDTSDVPF